MIALLLQLVGLGVVVAGAALADPWLGVSAAGGVLVVVGAAWEDHRGGD